MLGFKTLVKLDRKKYRQEYGVYLVEGKKAVLEATQAHLDGSINVIQLVVTPSFAKDHQEFMAQKEIQTFFKKNQVLELTHSSFAEISDTTSPQGIMAVVSLPKLSLEKIVNCNQKNDSKTIAVLDDVRDPGNVGTIIRTADWFGVDGLVCLGGADPFQPKVVRSSMGSIFRVPIYHVGRSEASQLQTEIISKIKSSGFKVITTLPDSQNLESISGFSNILSLNPNSNLCLILGNEARGTSAKINSLADDSITIPKLGSAESLNVAVSFGVLIAQRVTAKNL
jgi:RNA methyltransferase, TrmH family